jgi:hypothetical protein
VLSKKKEVRTPFGDGKETVVLIKPTSDAKYKNMVDVLDEMQINEISRYVLMDANDKETASLVSLDKFYRNRAQSAKHAP